MPVYSCEGIVLRATRIEEADRLVHFFTDRFGRIRARIRGVAKTTSRFGSVAEPLSHDRLSLYKPREDRAFFSLTGATLINAHEKLRNDLEKYYAACFILELVDSCTQDGDPHYNLWLALLETLHLLKEREKTGGLLLAFELVVFREAGLAMNFEQCAGCGCALGEPGGLSLSAAQGGILCPACRQLDRWAVEMSPQLAVFLIRAGGLSLSQAAALPAEGLWSESLRVFRPFWEQHLDFQPKSARFIEAE